MRSIYEIAADLFLFSPEGKSSGMNREQVIVMLRTRWPDEAEFRAYMDKQTRQAVSEKQQLAPKKLH